VSCCVNKFGALVNVSRHTLYSWKRRFEQQGPAGLMDAPRGSKSGIRGVAYHSKNSEIAATEICQALLPASDSTAASPAPSFAVPKALKPLHSL